VVAHPGSATPLQRADEFELITWRELIELDAGLRELVWKIDAEIAHQSERSEYRL
jgi:hypothetical protein